MSGGLHSRLCHAFLFRSKFSSSLHIIYFRTLKRRENGIVNDRFNGVDEHLPEDVSSAEADLRSCDVTGDVIPAADADVDVVEEMAVHQQVGHVRVRHRRHVGRQAD